ncbi:alpha/beta fold hydrolase [Trichothermofontia sp.]
MTEISPHRHTLALPDLQLSYLEWPATGDPIILLHGLADHAGVWASLGNDLATGAASAKGQRFNCVAPDLRGHGNSSKPATGYQTNVIVTDLNALLERLGWSAAHVVCHSWSAQIATVWATTYPDRVRSLILVDPFFIDRMPAWMGLTFPILYRVLPFLKMMGPFGSYEEAERVARRLKQYQGWTPFQQAVFRDSIEQKPDGRWGSKFVVQARNEIFEDVRRVAGLTRSLSVPSLFVQPAKGLNRTEWQLKPYRHYLQNLQVRQVPGNHWPFLVEPEAFNRTVGEFLMVGSF